MPKEFRICYIPSDITCECGCTMHRNQYTPWKMDGKYSIYKVRYRCLKCNKTIGPDLDWIAKKGFTYTEDINKIGLNINAVEHISYEKIKDYTNEENGTDISRQTAYNYKVSEYEEYIRLKEEKINEKLKKKEE